MPGTVISPDTKRYGIYVLGLKDGEEMMIVVPALKKQKAYEVDWVFDASFQEIIEKLNSSELGEICPKENYRLIEFVDYLDTIKMLFPAIGDTALDVNFMITYLRYGIVQIDGEIVIYGEGFEQHE
ncbi:MAG TPA: hypothetical protein H9728_04215 [Candidatus Borkfalkia excrementavium]|uniref:Uncharacterized protein n=1 Tax=Candidatus Borkfalkia excrementavium TaxID=2838505 RepID=A0A9D1Z7W6_9FIRM|nr:hypothetical protein [Candidatus Borkfalkia excrementavium]